MSEPSVNYPPSNTDEGHVAGMVFDEQYLQAHHERPFPLKLMFAGILLVGLFLAIFFLWTAVAPIASAVISEGVVTVASHRKEIQHLEGGIIEEIFVQESDHVSQGQVLLKLRDLHPAAELRKLERQQLEVQTTLARLLAEQAGQPTLEFPADLMARQDDATVAALMAAQTEIFNNRNTLFQEQQSVLGQKIAQKQEEITGLHGRIKASRREQQLIEEELKAIDSALKQGLIAKSEGLKLRQRHARIDGDLLDFQATIERLQQTILEIQVQTSEARAQHLADIKEELRRQQTSQYELAQKIPAARDILTRTAVLSPIDGVVVNLQVHTTDGVIKAGQTVMEIVPTGDELVIDAYINPKDIDEVHVGMPAEIKLTALTRRNRVPIKGMVVDLSADRLYDHAEQYKRGYYRGRVKLMPGDDLEGTNLVAGMGVRVYVSTGSRTFLSYLFAPLTSSLQASADTPPRTIPVAEAFYPLKTYDPAQAYYPTDKWSQLADPTLAGWSINKLEDAAQYAKAIHSDAVLVIYNGVVIMTYGDYVQRYKLHSVRKSLMSVMYGIFVAQGDIDINQTLAELGIDDVPPLTSAEKQATVRDLLMAKSGIYHTAAYETNTMETERPERETYAPGQFWFYNNWDFNALVTIFKQKTQQDFFTAFESALAKPLQMQDFRLADTEYRYENDKSIHPAYLFEMNALDLARVGLLYLRNGNWQGKQIADPAWIKASTSALHRWNENKPEKGYGYLWKAIEDGYYAAGVGGQRMFVAPKYNLVIVHQSDTRGGKRIDSRKIWNLYKKIVASMISRKALNQAADEETTQPTPSLGDE